MAIAGTQLFVCGMMLLATCRTCLSASDYTLNWKQLQAGRGVGVYQACNSHGKPQPEGYEKTFQASLVKVTLPPCTVRTMHLHRGVDEVNYVVKGTMKASMHIPDNSVPNAVFIDTEVTAGQSFLAPANFVHKLSNPSCTDSVTYMAFYNNVDASVTNVGTAAYNLANSPFKTYEDPSKSKNMAQHLGGLAYDAACQTRCNLCPKGYTQSPPPKEYQSPPTGYSEPPAYSQPPAYTQPPAYSQPPEPLPSYKK